ncbi:MAG: hypothetical protein ACKOYN_06535, partial [Planctomycetota bacterium]
ASDWRASTPAWEPSPLVAAWAVAAGLPAFVHESLDADAFGGNAAVLRFGDDVSRCAEMLCDARVPARV